MPESIPLARHRTLAWCLVAVYLIGLILPAGKTMPVTGATPTDWHPQSYWYHPWGTSGVHRGIDIFAAPGTPVVASTAGIILSKGYTKKGGHYVLVLGSKWRLFYYAHLQEIQPGLGVYTQSGARLGSVGDTGNASGKPPHLHYSIRTLVPLLWQIRRQPYGWLKPFFVDPNSQLT